MQQLSYFDYANLFNKERKRYEQWKTKQPSNIIKFMIDNYRTMINDKRNTILRNPNFRLEWLDLLPGSYSDLDLYAISPNYNITIKFIEDYPSWNFNWTALTYNKSLTLSDILSHPELPWDSDAIAQKYDVTIEDIINHPEIRWSYTILYPSQIITIDSYDDAKKYAHLLRNPPTVEIIESNPDVPWNYDFIFKEFDIPFEFMLKHKDDLEDGMFGDVFYGQNIPVKYFAEKDPYDDDDENIDEMTLGGSISSKYNLTIKDILDYPNVDWDWNRISSNPNITMDDIKSHPELNWNWRNISLNPNITIEFIRDNIERLDMEYLCSNSQVYNNWAGFNQMKRDIRRRRDFICNTLNLGILLDLGEIVAAYCDYL